MTSKLSSPARAGLTADISRGAVRHFVFSAETVQRGAGVSSDTVVIELADEHSEAITSTSLAAPSYVTALFDLVIPEKAACSLLNTPARPLLTAQSLSATPTCPAVPFVEETVPLHHHIPIIQSAPRLELGVLVLLYW